MTRPGDQTPGSSAEQDPTGIRDLLASLPEPGPMPDILSRRIADSLAREAAQRHGDPAQHATRAPHPGHVPPPPRNTSPVPAEGSVVPFQRPERAAGGRSRPRVPWLVAAAAAITVGAAGGVSAFLISGEETPPMAIPPNDAEQEAPGSPQAQPGPYTDVKIWDTGNAYESDQLSAQVGAFLSPQSQLELSLTGEGEEPATTAWQCVVGLPDVDAAQVEQVRADRSTLDGEPAVLLAVYTTDDRLQVWAVDPDCSAGTRVIEGPIAPTF